MNHPSGSLLDKTLSEQYIHLPGSRRRADRVDLDRPRPSPELRQGRPRDRDRVRLEAAARPGAGLRGKTPGVPGLGVQEYWIIDRFQRIMTVVAESRRREPVEQVVKENEVYARRCSPASSCRWPAS